METFVRKLSITARLRLTYRGPQKICRKKASLKRGLNFKCVKGIFEMMLGGIQKSGFEAVVLRFCLGFVEAFAGWETGIFDGNLVKATQSS
jgi:hypothetical protein